MFCVGSGKDFSIQIQLRVSTPLPTHRYVTRFRKLGVCHDFTGEAFFCGRNAFLNIITGGPVEGMLSWVTPKSQCSDWEHCSFALRFKKDIYSALRKYSAPLNFATFCHISGYKHKDIPLYFFVKNQQQVGHNHEVYWIFQTFLTNQKLKNWACKIIQPP